MNLEKEIKRAHAIISKYRAKTMDLEKELRRAHAIINKYKTKMNKYKTKVADLEIENSQLKATLAQEFSRQAEENPMFQPNYFRINKPAFWFYHFAIIDKMPEYMADQIFIENGIPVSFGKEFESPKKNYKIIFVKVRKKYGKEFLKAMRKLESAILENGYTDYLDYCKEAQQFFRKVV